jgi:hypothetical protein
MSPSPQIYASFLAKPESQQVLYWLGELVELDRSRVFESDEAKSIGARIEIFPDRRGGILQSDAWSFTFMSDVRGGGSFHTKFQKAHDSHSGAALSVSKCFAGLSDRTHDETLRGINALYAYTRIHDALNPQDLEQTALISEFIFDLEKEVAAHMKACEKNLNDSLNNGNIQRIEENIEDLAKEFSVKLGSPNRLEGAFDFNQDPRGPTVIFKVANEVVRIPVNHFRFPYFQESVPEYRERFAPSSSSLLVPDKQKLDSHERYSLFDRSSSEDPAPPEDGDDDDESDQSAGRMTMR